MWVAPFARLVSLVLCALLTALAGPAIAMERGEYVARIGDCVSCHSAPGGKPYAGGLRMSMPFGAIFTTNITPDKATGIGDWNFADFDRALRQGIAKDGHHLYPAMPYPSFAKISDADMHALFDFVMHDIAPVRQRNRANEIVWPLDMRWPLAIWNWLFVSGGRYRPDPARDATWNRGAYLVETLGHCGACHTPRSVAWNEVAMTGRDPRFLSGAMLDFWSAPDLRGDARTGLGSWSNADIVAFLKTGHNGHGAVFGSMNEVTRNSTPYLNDADLDAIAAYLKSLPPYRSAAATGAASERRMSGLPARHVVTPGAVLYQGYCARCHGVDGAGQDDRVPPLAGNPVLLDPDPTSAIHMILDGGKATSPNFPKAETMPAFRPLLSDDALAETVSFIRRNWGNDTASVGTEEVRTVRLGSRPDPDQLARGRALVKATGCGGCHRIPHISAASGLAGPPLDNIGRQTMIAGLLANNPANMAAWLQSPQGIKPGDAMPDLGLSKQDAEDIAAFLSTLRE